MSSVKQTIIEMLSDRGYVITDNSVESMLLAKDSEFTNLIVLISHEEKLSINSIKEYISDIKTLEKQIGEKIEKAIIVYKKCITASAKKVLSNISHIEIQEFNETQLHYNPTHHKYYNPHEKIEGDEFNNIKKQYGTKLPIILSTDPITRYFNFKKGDIIRITRKNNIIAYRIVR